MQGQADEADEVQSRQDYEQPFAVFGQASEARHPPETALHHSKDWHKYQVVPGLRQLDHVQGDELPSGHPHRLPAGVCVVQKGNPEASERRRQVRRCSRHFGKVCVFPRPKPTKSYPRLITRVRSLDCPNKFQKTLLGGDG